MFNTILPVLSRKSRQCILLAGAAIPALVIPQTALAQAENAETAPVVNEIVVTANRREELAQDVPIAITAFAPERLEQQGITKEQDLQASVPSLVVGPNGQGSRDSMAFTLRGQGATFQASPGVVVYVNEVPLPAAITLSQQGGPGNFIDIENLQVLAGPQGTLFGRNTTGGAVLLTPRRPTDEFGGWIKGETGNFERAYIEGAVNIPILEDKILLRAVGAYHSRKGFTEDVVWNKFRDNENWHSGRLGLTLRPVEGVENYTMAYFARSENNGAGLVHRGFNIPALKSIGSFDAAGRFTPTPFCFDPGENPGPFGVPCSVYRQATADAVALGNRKTAFSTDVFQATKTWGFTNTTDINITDDITLRNIISFQKLKIGYRYDGDATILQQHDVDPGRLPQPGAVRLPVLGFPITYANSTIASELPRDDLKQFTEELQMQGQSFGGALDWTVGGFYYEQKPDGKQGSRAVVYCPAAFTGFCEASFNEYGTSTVSKALYAQASINFGAFAPSLEGLRLTGGYRYTWDRITGFASQYQRAAANPALAVCGSDSRIVPFATARADCEFGARLKTKAPSWLIGLDYKVTPDLLLFAKVNRGYKAGGFNQYAVFTNTRTFDPETVTAYEAGFKSDFRLGSVPFRLNVTGYTLEYKGIQRASGDFNPFTGAGGARTQNADARIKGIEVEASIRPAAGLEIGGNFGLTDANYTKYEFQTLTGGIGCNGVVAPGGTVDASCLDFQYTAKYIWSVHASFDQPLPGDLGTLSFFANYSHTSRQNTEAVNLPALQPGAVLEPFGLLNASIDWRDIGGTGLDAGIFATNLTNETYRISNADVFQQGGLLYWSTLFGEPRMYGLRVTYRFGGEER